MPTRITYHLNPNTHPHHLKTYLLLSNFEQKLLQRTLLESQLISLLDSSPSLSHLKHLHTYILRRGLDQCSFVLAKLVRVLTKLNVPIDPYPKLFFDQVHSPNAFMLTSVIRGYTTVGAMEAAIEVYMKMRQERIMPVLFTFTAIFKGCSERFDIKLGGRFMPRVSVRGICMEGAVGLFEGMPEKGMVAWTAVNSRYTQNEKPGEALRMFDWMRRKV